MKLFATLALGLSLISTALFAQGSFTVTAEGLYDAAQYPVGPGGTIYIKAGTYKMLRFRNYKGSATAPIKIVNLGGLVNMVSTETNGSGINFLGCQYFKLSGTGDPAIKYGIKVSQTGSGASAISIGNKSSDAEVENVEIAHAGFAGMMIKTDPIACDQSTWRQNFTMYNVKVHDNYIHDVQGEGLYIGNSFYAGLNTTCNGTAVKMFPHDIMNLEIYNNLVERAGCEGIQYACAPNAQVHHNVVRNSGLSPFDKAQNNGIQISGGAGGSFYNNTIRDTPGVGLMILGHLGNNLIYNNVVANSNAYGVFIDEREGSQANVPVHFINNTIVNSGLDGFRLYNETQTTNLINNVIARVGSTGTASKHIHLLTSTVKFVDANNYKSLDVASAGFVNAASFDFRPASGSPLIDKGQNITTQYGIQKDLGEIARLSGAGVDIGAFEFGSALKAARLGASSVVRVSTSEDGVATVKLSTNESITELLVLNLSGQVVSKQVPTSGATEVVISLDQLTSGTYLLRVSTTEGKYASYLVKP